MSDDRREKQYHHHDPINYLRAVRGDEEQSSDNLRRLDSDDEAYGAVEEHPDYFALGGVTDDLAAVCLQKDDRDEDLVATTAEDSEVDRKSTNEFPPMPEARRAYRPQSIGSTPQPPARERPDPDSAWPYRETLSFTRSLIFYGAGEFQTNLSKLL